MAFNPSRELLLQVHLHLILAQLQLILAEIKIIVAINSSRDGYYCKPKSRLLQAVTVRRVQIEELTKAIDGLKESWSDLYSDEKKVGNRVN